MRKIPPLVRQELADDPWMHHCCLADEYCKGVIQWHHNLIYGGRQSDIKESILPVCVYHHRLAEYPSFKRILNWIMLSRMSDELVQSISKATDYVYKKQQLIKEFGKQYIARSL